MGVCGCMCVCAGVCVCGRAGVRVCAVSGWAHTHLLTHSPATHAQGEDYHWCTREIMQVANMTCSGRVVSVMEGGYGHYSRAHGIDRSSLARNVAAHVSALAGRPVHR